MDINPQEFEVSETLLRQRLHLSQKSTVFPFGFEGLSNNALVRVLQTRYDVFSLYFRTRPDFIIIDDYDVYLVEAKQRTKNVEATQLLFNKYHERIGIKVLYSFPEITIRASQIPMETLVIPENYREKFDSNLKHLFENEGVEDFRYVRPVTEGSGDAFVPVELEDLRILSEEITV
jgi:hypothetical protein